MIPNFKSSGILPPFIDNPNGPSDGNQMAPYKTSLVEFIGQFSISPERNAILKGFLAYRKQLKALGITKGFQWVDGSFVEDCEKNRSRPPKDVDFVTFAYRPPQIIDEQKWKAFVESNISFFGDNDGIKKLYFSDAYYVDLNAAPHLIVDYTRYWFGLFSHQRETYVWKGCLQINLCEDEDSVLTLLEHKNAT